MKAEVTGVTVSVEFGFEGDYGKGTKSFASIQSRYPDPTQDIQTVVEDGLEMYISAWKAVLAGRCTHGLMKGVEFRETVENVNRRLDKVKAMLRTDDGQQQQ